MEKEPQKVVPNEFQAGVQLSPEVCVLKDDAFLKRHEVKVFVSTHDGDAPCQTVRRKQVIGVEEDDQIGPAFGNAEIAAHIRAGFVTRPLNVAEAWIGGRAPGDLLCRAVIRSVIHNDVFPGLEALPLNRVHGLAKQREPVLSRCDDRDDGVHGLGQQGG